MTQNVFDSNPNARRAVKHSTGLAGDELDRVIDGLAGPVSLRRREKTPAREVGLEHSNFRKKLMRMKDTLPDAEQRHQAAEERILWLAAKRRSSQGLTTGSNVTQNALAEALPKMQITVESPDPVIEASDVTPVDDANSKT